MSDRGPREAREIVGAKEQSDAQTRDEWAGNTQEVIRFHRQERRALFTPAKVDEDFRPCQVKEIGDVRITEGISASGDKFTIQDYWRAAKNPHRNMKEAWVGQTGLCRRCE